MANRHLSRSIAMQSLYEWDFWGRDEKRIPEIVERNSREFGPGLEDTAFIRDLVNGVIKRREKIDLIIEKTAPEWPLEQINMVDRNVLRLGIYELLFGNRKEVPPKVAINEAIELAKTFGGESSGKFVNGVLGTIYREIGEPGKEEGKSAEELAGAIVFRRDEDKIAVAMVKDAFGYWTFPKGHLEKLESPEDAVRREVKEEVGLSGKILKELPGMSYVAHEDKKEVTRTVTFFLIETTDQELQLEKSTGLKAAKWVPLKEIKNGKHYENQNELIDEAIREITVHVESRNT